MGLVDGRWSMVVGCRRFAVGLASVPRPCLNRGGCRALPGRAGEGTHPYVGSGDIRDRTLANGPFTPATQLEALTES
jgi:hypothetical protein